MRRVIAMIEVNESKITVAEDSGTIDFLEKEFGFLSGRGIFLKDAKILDDDDVYDSKAIELANEIFGLENQMEVKKCTFTSVWDGGYEVTTNCKVNTKTKEVFDIEISPATTDYDELEYEYITIDGIDYSVSNDIENADFWYQ